MENDIPWQMVSAIGVDNTNENIGTWNSIKTRGLAKNKEIVTAGWTCHILHIAAGKATDDFPETPRFDVEDHCVYIFLLVWQMIQMKVRTRVILRSLWFSISTSN